MICSRMTTSRLSCERLCLRSRIPHAVVWCFIFASVCCNPIHTLGREGLIEKLYEHFLANGGSETLVTFEREGLIPARETGKKQAALANGLVGQVNLWNKDYMTILKSGSSFVVGFSVTAPATNESDFASAEELLGFDGEFYWNLSLSKPIRLQFLQTNGVQALPAEIGFNSLTIIPKSEASHSQGQFQSDVKLGKIRGLAAECYSVVQFGYTDPLPIEPPVRRGPLRLGIGSQVADVSGDVERPSRLEYRELSQRTKTSISMDYRSDTLTVSRSTDGEIWFKTRYRLLQISVMPVARRADAPFSWRTYKARAGNTIDTIATNGVTAKAVLTNGQVRAGETIDKARPSDGR